MKVALIGASGRIGSQILDELVSRGHHVTAIARHTDKIAPRPHVTVAAGDLSDTPALAKLLHGHDAIISSVRFKSFRPPQMLDAIKANEQ